MEFKINFAYFVSLFLLVIFSVSLADEVCKAISNKRKKKLSTCAFKNLLDNIDCFQKKFLIKEYNFTAEQLDNKSDAALCELCGCKDKCSSYGYPMCLLKDDD